MEGKDSRSPLDLTQGVRLEEFPDGEPVLCDGGGESVVVVRRGDELFATGASCSHYGGPLAKGVVVGDTIRCPWHHACFDLRTGLAVGAPAIDPIPAYQLEQMGGLVRLGQPKDSPKSDAPRTSPSSVVIVGAGAAGTACAWMLRQEGYQGPILLIGDEAPGPVDRPNLSKDYLAGEAPEEWLPLRTPESLAQNGIELMLGDEVRACDVPTKRVELASGKQISYGALVLATGASPRRLSIVGAEKALTLRTLADTRAIIAKAEGARQAVVIGASFIGLEVAASLRKRGLEVRVVGPEEVPLARILGPELGRFVQNLHEAQGVRFHLGRSPGRITEEAVVLDDGTTLAAQLVVMGVGVRPRTGLAEAMALEVDDGVVVDENLQTSAANVYAAGDIARLPYGGESIRIEHWVVAERHGQAIARNILGKGRPFREPPFFWSRHYDLSIACVGNLRGWDRVDLHGALDDRRAFAAYRKDGRVRAVAAIGMGKLALRAEELLARGEQEELETLLATAR